MIANTDLHNKPDVHWWSILDTDERDILLFFDSFGTYGLLKFIFDNDLEIFQKLILGQIKKILKQDNKITLLTWNFKLKNYEKLTQKELNSLWSTAQHFLKFLYEFGTYKKIKNTLKVVTVDDNLQSFSADYCGVLQLYFYLNLFEPLNTSIVAKKSTKKLDITLIGELLNELFNTKTHQNERILDAFILQHGFEFDKISDQEKKKARPKIQMMKI